MPLLARANTPQIHPCWVDSLTDPKKYPMCFRNAPTNQQIGGAANRYVVEVLKRKKVAVISDTTGYGTASVNAYVPMLKAKGAEVVYQGNVDAANPDLKPELLRMQIGRRRSDHALERECRLPVAHHQYARADGLGRADRRPDHARLRPDQGAAGKARILGQGLSEQFPPGLLRRERQAAGSHQRLRRSSEERQDRHGRHAAVVDRARLRLAAHDRGGDEERSAPSRRQIVGYLNKLKNFAGVYGDISFTPEQHDGYPDDEVVMVEANSLKDGAFNLAPGYGA